jgi:hypothetical protein
MWLDISAEIEQWSYLVGMSFGPRWKTILDNIAISAMIAKGQRHPGKRSMRCSM